MLTLDLTHLKRTVLKRAQPSSALPLSPLFSFAKRDTSANGRRAVATNSFNNIRGHSFHRYRDPYVPFTIVIAHASAILEKVLLARSINGARESYG